MRRKISPEMWDEARRLWDAGATCSEIATRLQCGASNVAERAGRYAWPRHDGKPRKYQRKQQLRSQAVRVRCSACWNTYACESGEAVFSVQCPHCAGGTMREGVA